MGTVMSNQQGRTVKRKANVNLSSPPGFNGGAGSNCHSHTFQYPMAGRRMHTQQNMFIILLVETT